MLYLQLIFLRRAAKRGRVRFTAQGSRHRNMREYSIWDIEYFKGIVNHLKNQTNFSPSFSSFFIPQGLFLPMFSISFCFVTISSFLIVPSILPSFSLRYPLYQHYIYNTCIYNFDFSLPCSLQYSTHKLICFPILILSPTAFHVIF